jgi:uncharacterized membrane protein YkvA (DUF1232 family)
MWLFRLRRTFRLAGRDALILFFAIRDPRTPRALKLAAAVAIAWVVSPIDPIPDLPVIGWVDDLLVLSVGIPLLLGRLPDPVRLQAQMQADRFIAAWWPGRKPDAAADQSDVAQPVPIKAGKAARKPRPSAQRRKGAA